MSPRFATPSSVPARAASGCRRWPRSRLIAIVVAGMFASMVVTVRSLDATSKAGRKASEMTQSALQLERLVVDLETGVRGYLLTDDTSSWSPTARPQRSRPRGELERLSRRSCAAAVDRIDATSTPTSPTTPSR